MKKILSIIGLLSLLQAGLSGEVKSFEHQNYFIKFDYVSRSSYTHYDDTKLKDEYQDEVYAAAYALANKHNLLQIGDIGCGSGYKLLKYFKDYKTVGFEINPTYKFLRKTYPKRVWIKSDFNKIPKQHQFDLLICSDVIEHLTNPDDLLNWISQFDFEYLVLSTPDRDILKSLQSHTGPPTNKAHVREWNAGELNQYVSEYFEIIDHFHGEKEKYDQIIIAKKKSLMGDTD